MKFLFVFVLNFLSIDDVKFSALVEADGKLQGRLAAAAKNRVLFQDQSARL